MAHGGVLVTLNTDEFKRVPGLSTESWVEVG
jgi:predicted nucleic acid-binding protein